MSTIIGYKVTRADYGGYNVKSVNKEVVEAFGWAATEEGAILAFKDDVTKKLPKENALIFVTEEQVAAMKGYSEMEKYGGEVHIDTTGDPSVDCVNSLAEAQALVRCTQCKEDPCQCCDACNGPCQGH